MKKIEYYLPDVNFIITVDEKHYDLLKNKVDESIIPMESNTSNTINIEYIVDLNEFKRIKELIKNSNGKIYYSFKKQTHKEIIKEEKHYFLVNSEDYICVKTDDKNYAIIVENNNENSRNWVARIIRELYLREKEDMGFSYMHGTGIVTHNKGILLLGTSGSGKTTLAVKFMDTENETKFLSNDRVLVDIKDNMDYFPHAVTYAMGTVRNNKKLDNYFRINRLIEEKKHRNYEEVTNDFDCNTPLTDVEKVFPNTKMCARTKITDIIYPKFEVERDSVEVIDMTDGEKKELLLKTNFTPNDTEALRKEWLRKRKITEKELQIKKEELLKHLVKKINIKKLKYGADSNIEKILNRI
ncbi:MAG: hypothetical protein V8R82_01515 [Clostridia bacterium]